MIRSTLLIAASFLALPLAPLSAEEAMPLPAHVIAEFGAPPTIPEGALPAPLEEALDTLVRHGIGQANWDPSDTAAFDAVRAAGDPRAAWLLTDMLRFTWRREFGFALGETLFAVTELEPDAFMNRGDIIDHLMAWDMPAYPGYLAHKKAIFTNYIPGWEEIFQEGNIDWHLVDWGGVYIDDRPMEQTNDLCNCIPAADNPEVSTAAEATWLEDDDVIFGIEINGEARAYPRRIMEVREMVNDTLGGRDLGIPYCTLCGAAQAFFTDGMPEGVERPVLRTSGLLSRSNKVMYDLNTYSVFDTFLGTALTGPLAEKGIELDQATVITTDWGTWKATYPDTTVLVERLALGRDFDFRNGRDANGPIFPVGDVDPRLPVHEDVVGAVTASGQAVAFQRSAALVALNAGQDITFENIRLELEAGGLKAVDADGSDLGSHQAFWFAWSQFHPGTALWPAE
ncbi:MAG: DUF3179 domain-containing (seleno)protein [Pseudomonadota bacterium]